MRIDRENNEIVVRIPSDLDSKRLQKILDLIRYGELTSKSSASQKQADDIASKINKDWWAKNKDRFLK